jgi:tRNA dimethylallyltransferase
MTSKFKNTLISIVGPTAIGKTALSIDLAKQFNSDIISCDSRQFYKEMNIGTAVPSPEELAAATHHFIQDRSIFDAYNVGQFEKEVLTKLEELFLKNPIQIMVGGSGLYVDAVLKGLDYFPEIDASVREALQNEFENKGLAFLQDKLKELDADTYNSIKIDNPQRVLRALEVCIGSGIPYSTFKNKPKALRNFNIIKIGLNAERNIIYHRINKRVDIMIEKGLLEEAKKLYPHKKLNALQTVGYRELFSYFDSDFTQEFAISEIKKNTRRFAKRQLTWFRKDPATLWYDYQTDIEKILSTISDKINTF